MVVFADDSVKIEARIYNVDSGAKTAMLDVRITNKLDFDLTVSNFKMTVWANPERTAKLSAAEVQVIVVPAGSAATKTLKIIFENTDSFSGKVWVDVSATWQWGDGSPPRHEAVVGVEFSVNAALKKFGG